MRLGAAGLIALVACTGCTGLTLRNLPGLQVDVPAAQVTQTPNSTVYAWANLGTLTLAPSHVGAHGSLSITFTATAKLAARPTVQVGGRTATLAQQSGAMSVFTYAASDSEAVGQTPVVLDAQVDSDPLTLRASVVFDSVAPSVGVPQVVPTDGTYVGTPFVASAALTDDQNIAACQVCTQEAGCGPGQWTPGVWQAGTCRVAGLTCADQQTVHLVVQGTDWAGNVSTSGAASWLCDGTAPVGLAPSTPDDANSAFVPSPFRLSAAFTDTGTGVTGCDVCLGAATTCAAWTPAQWSQGVCSAAGLTCQTGAVLQLTVRAHDGVGNLGYATLARTCDAQVDSVGAVALSGFPTGSTTAVPASFTVSAAFGDARGIGLRSCDVCVGTQGTCSGAWSAGTLAQDGTCSGARTCADGSTLTLAVRATDGLGNVGSTQPVTRVCDGKPPVITSLVASRRSRSQLQLDWAASDGGAGLSAQPYRLDYGQASAFGGTRATEGASPLTGLSAASQRLSGLTGCHRYYVGVRATDAVGNVSPVRQLSVPLGCGNDGLLVAPGTTYGTAFASTLVVADFNRDGAPDVAVAKTQLQAMRIRFGDVDGSGRPLGTYNGTSTDYVLNGGTLMGMAAGDFNADGIIDLALNSNIAGVNLLLGAATNNVADGNLVLQSANYAVGASPAQVVVADVNGDRISDLLAVSPNDRLLYTLLGTGSNGQGDGKFAVARTQAVGTAWALVAADFDGDRVVDVVTTDASGNGSLQFLHGDNDGTYAAPVSYSATASGASWPNSVAAADLNSDGILDLITAGPGQAKVSVLLGRGSNGRGNGQFSAPVDYAAAAVPTTVVLADFNADGIADVLLAHNAQPAVGVLLTNSDGAGHGLGTLAGESTVDTGYKGPAHAGLVAADINVDGLMDAVVAVADSSSTVLSYTVVLGEGLAPTPSGGALSVWQQPVGAPVHALLGADFTGDGVLDLVGLSSSGVTLMTGDGGGGQGGVGSFSRAATLYSGSAGTNNYGSVADYNLDGIPDLAYANGNAQASLLTAGGSGGRGNGSFASPVVVTAAASAAGTWWTAAADLNNDGIPDLAVTDASKGTVDVLLGNGQGGLVARDSYAIAGYVPLYVGAVDFNHDGALDLVVSSLTAGPNNLCVMLNRGSASGSGVLFNGCIYASAGNSPEAMALADLNSDGIPDVAVSNYNDGTLSVLLGAGSAGRGTGALQPLNTYSIGAHPTYVQAADLHRGGALDLLVAYDVGVMRLDANKTAGHGNGTFTPGGAVATTGVPGGLIVADLDADGMLDFVTTDAGNQCLDVFYGTGTYPP